MGLTCDALLETQVVTASGAVLRVSPRSHPDRFCSFNPGGAGITLFAWGGAINRVAPDATAFVHRGAAFLMDSETTWTALDSPPVVSANLDWLAGLHHALVPFGTAQAYQNFIDPALRDWKTAYYGGNLPRLTAVKRRYDPDDAFRFAQSIPERLPRRRAA